MVDRWRRSAAWRRAARLVHHAEAPLVRWGSPALTIALLGAALLELRRIDWRMVREVVPHAPLFWLAFAAFYATPVLADWAIYRRLWAMPAAGLVACARKAISNDLLIGYSGEAGLYGWARRAGRLAPLSALKDVSILSAAVGNLVTIAAGLAALPCLHTLGIGMPGWASILPVAAILSVPLVLTAMGRRVFHLGFADLAVVAGLHLARAAGTVFWTVMLWHIAMPQVAWGAWASLIAVKLLVSRLPLVSNKELMFASAALLLLGPATPIAALMTLLATLLMATHVAVALGLGLVADGARPGAARAATLGV